MIQKSTKDETSTPKTLKVLSNDTSVFYHKFWAQVSGLADNCSAGVLGRIGGVSSRPQQGEPLFYSQKTAISTPSKDTTKKYNYVITERDIPTFPKKPPKKISTWFDLVEHVVPSNKLYMAPAEWLYYAILQNLYTKGLTGTHRARICPKDQPYPVMDGENNKYHLFWASQTFRVKIWIITGNSHSLKSLTTQSFVEWAKKNNYIYYVDGIVGSGSYHSRDVWIGSFTLNTKKVGEDLPKELEKARKVIQSRWKLAEKYRNPTLSAITDKVAALW